jgi:hypothetical protein
MFYGLRVSIRRPCGREIEQEIEMQELLQRLETWLLRSNRRGMSINVVDLEDGRRILHVVVYQGWTKYAEGDLESSLAWLLNQAEEQDRLDNEVQQVEAARKELVQEGLLPSDS